MSDIHFRFAPAILARLGEELNPSPSKGIIELIRKTEKNLEICWQYRNIVV